MIISAQITVVFYDGLRRKEGVPVCLRGCSKEDEN